MVGGEAADDRSSSSSSEAAVVGKNAIEDIKAPNAFRKDGEPDYKPKKVTWSSLPHSFLVQVRPSRFDFFGKYIQSILSIYRVLNVSSVCRPGLV